MALNPILPDISQRLCVVRSSEEIISKSVETLGNQTRPYLDKAEIKAVFFRNVECILNYPLQVKTRVSLRSFISREE